jgi:hypothetical protein
MIPGVGASGDRPWSRYERPLDAVDLTECAGTRAGSDGTGMSKVCAPIRRSRKLADEMIGGFAHLSNL